MTDELKQNDFYNHKQKQQYLNELTNDLKNNDNSNNTSRSAVSRITTVFRQAKQYEEMRNCDISKMTKNQLLIVLPQMLCSNKSAMITVRRSFYSLLSYVEWCESLYYVDVDMWKSIDIFSLKNTDIIRESYYKDPLDFCQSLEYFYFPNSSFKEDNTTKRIYFISLLLLYNGVSEEYFEFLLRDNFDFVNNMINIKNTQNNLQINMIPEFIKYYKSVCESTKCRVSSSALHERPFLQPEFILSVPRYYVEDVHEKIKTSLRLINRDKKLLLDKNKKVINKKIIETSGLFYRIYRKELADVNNFKFTNYVKYKFGTTEYCNLKYDYELFKKAYYSNLSM